jgi:putative acetyltransferase
VGLADGEDQRLPGRAVVNIRNEQAGDYVAIRRLLTEAFGGESEAKLVDSLRADGDLAIALVADIEGEIAGYVAMSVLKSPPRSLALAPVAVAPARQRQGVGSALIEETLRRARAAEGGMVFVVGDPEYYARFGFRADAARSFDSPYAGEHFMAIALTETPASAAPVFYSRRFAEL